jgi:hypothetical protein
MFTNCGGGGYSEDVKILLDLTGELDIRGVAVAPR